MSEKKPTFQKPTRAAGPADLAELKATDALLDRLAANGLSETDREDPLVAAFAQLRVALDEPSDDAGLDVGRLIEVLGDRPLYLVDAKEAADATAADSPINLGRPAQTPARKVVDVRDGALRHARDTRPVAARQPAGQVSGVAGVAARVGDATSAAVGATVRSIHSITAGRRAAHGRLDDDLRPRWQQIAGQVALPAASVVALLVIGSGVSAAVTGNPMAPVAGMSKVVQQLPGIDDGPSPESVTASIMAAGQLAEQGRPGAVQQARTLLADASTKIDDLPESAQSVVKKQFDATQEQVDAAAASPTSVPTVSAPAVTPAATPAPAASATPTAPTTTDSTQAPATPSPSAATASASASVGAAAVPAP